MTIPRNAFVPATGIIYNTQTQGSATPTTHIMQLQLFSRHISFTASYRNSRNVTSSVIIVISSDSVHLKRCFDTVAVFGNNDQRYFILSTILKPIKHDRFVSTLSKGRNLTENYLDIVAKNGNNVEATFDFVKRTIFYDKLVRHCCRFGNNVECCIDKVKRYDTIRCNRLTCTQKLTRWPA